MNSIHDYESLGDNFYSFVSPDGFEKASFIALNENLLEELKMQDFKDLAFYCGLKLFPNFKPKALVYAGHQFGHFSPQLGDGRAALVYQSEGYDVQLKGSGQTPYSRNGDGLSALGPVVREYLLSEAMHALGVPTTRALAAVRTNEDVLREDYLPGGVFARVSKGHVRIGTFQYFASIGDKKSVKKLADYSINRFYPECATAENPYLEFFKQVGDRLTSLVAQWMSLGFIHGVMNTDNMSICGETIDFGPCAFMDHFHFERVYSYIDRNGRYRYDNQNHIIIWNLARLADCLIPFVDEDSEKAVGILNEQLEGLSEKVNKEFAKNLLLKMGIRSPKAGDSDLLDQYLDELQENEADFTNSFLSLSEKFNSSELSPALHAWKKRIEEESWSSESLKEFLLKQNPRFIPRNHIVEEVIEASLKGDNKPFREFLTVLLSPFENQDVSQRYQEPPKDEEIVENTFCGT